MTNSQLFKQAHAMTKQVIKSGDNYQVTFGQCLKAIKTEAKQVKPTMLQVIIFTLLAMVQVMLDSREFLVKLYPATFAYYENKDRWMTCAVTQKLLKELEEEEEREKELYAL